MRRDDARARVGRLVAIFEEQTKLASKLMRDDTGATATKAALDKEAMVLFIDIGTDVLDMMERIATSLEKLTAPRGP